MKKILNQIIVASLILVTICSCEIEIPVPNELATNSKLVLYSEIKANADTVFFMMNRSVPIFNKNKNINTDIALKEVKVINNNVTYPYRKFTFSYTGNVYGPMLLPVLPNDYRPSYSPWFSIQNIQVSYQKNTKAIEWFIAVKNLLNFTPKDPIMRPFDPFDKRITENNPNNYTFDPNYTYASMQKIRLVVGVKWNLM